MNIDLSKIQNNSNIDDDLESIEDVQEEPQEIPQVNPNFPPTFERLQQQVDAIKEIEIDDPLYKSQLINDISQWYNTFHKLLVGVDIKHLEKKKVSDLELLFKRIMDIVENRNIHSQVNQFIFEIPKTIESIGTNHMGLNLNGYATFVNSQEDYYYTCQEIILKNRLTEQFKVNPIYRLGLTLAYSAYHVNNFNIKKEQMGSKLDKPVDNDLKEQFNNLKS